MMCTVLCLSKIRHDGLIEFRDHTGLTSSGGPLRTNPPMCPPRLSVLLLRAELLLHTSGDTRL